MALVGKFGDYEEFWGEGFYGICRYGVDGFEEVGSGYGLEDFWSFN